MSRIYTVALTSRATGIVNQWEGEAVCVLDALQLARQSVPQPALHTAKVVGVK